MMMMMGIGLEFELASNLNYRCGIDSRALRCFERKRRKKRGGKRERGGAKVVSGRESFFFKEGYN